MQTFLPYPDYEKSAKALDNKRLGKQRVEVLQILTAIVHDRGWVYHPAVHMWRGHVNALVEYGEAICKEWLSRGCLDNCREKILEFKTDGSCKPPPWFDQEDFHACHRSNLKRKDATYYWQFEDAPNKPYCWPIQRKDGLWLMRFKHAGVPKYEASMEYLL